MKDLCSIISSWSSSKVNLLIFLLFSVVRIAFAWFSGFDNYELQTDAYRYIWLSEKVMKGDFNFDIGMFIVAPVYPVFVAIHKLIFGSVWDTALVISQIIISSLSGIYLFRIARLLFPSNIQVAIGSAIVYCFFPLTFYYVHTFAQEMLFQSLLIIFIYYLIFSVQNNSIKYLIVSAGFFSIAFLTKSHLLIYAPFIVLYCMVYYMKSWKRGLTFSLLFGVISFAFSLPFGLYNLKHHKVYTLSSNGAELFFYAGNTEYSYRWIVETPERGSKEFKILLGLESGFSFYNGKSFDSITALPHKVKQPLYLQQAILWIKNNNEKFWQLKWVDLQKFLMPGLSYSHYSFNKYLFSLLISLPIYLFGYFGILIALRKNFPAHLWMLGLFLMMLAFSLVFYPQARFRTITLEPFYILYGVYGFCKIIEYQRSKKYSVEA